MPKTLPKVWTQEWKAQFTQTHDEGEAMLLERIHGVSKDTMAIILRDFSLSLEQAYIEKSDVRQTELEVATYGLMHMIQTAYKDNQENPE